MMYEIVSSTKFKKDLKLALKRNYDISLLENIVAILAKRKTTS